METSDITKYLCLILIWITLFRLWKNRKLYLLSWKLPGPISWPFLGNALELDMVSKINDLYMNVKKITDKYGSCCRVWLGTELCVVCNEAEDFECVLSSKIASKKSHKYEFMIPYLGYGLMTSSGQYYVDHRHLLNPSFNSDNLKGHIGVHNQHAFEMIEKMTSEVLDDKVDVSIYILRYTAGTLSEFIFGVKNDFQLGKMDHVLPLGINAVKCFYERICRPWLASNFVYNMTSGGYLTRELLKIHTVYFGNMIKKAQSAPRATERRLRTPLEIMLEAHRDGKMTYQEINTECSSMYYPGVDSIYTSICFFVLMMANHQDCQKKAWQEIENVMGAEYEGPVLQEHINRLKYLEMCFKESNRLHPTGVSLLRRVDEDFYMKHRDLVIPAGASILLSVYSMNMNSKYWENPEAFVPERFSPENSATRPNYSYVPFSAGLRTCIGKPISNDVLIVAGVHLLRNFKFHSITKNIPLTSDVSIRSAADYKVLISKRTH